MDSRDIYLRYFTDDKLHCDAESNILPSENEGSLEHIETMFADINDGNLAWTIDGYSILMNPEQTKDINNIKSMNNTEVPNNDVSLCNEPLSLQLNIDEPTEILINDNNTIEITNDPIFNGSEAVMGQQGSLRHLSLNNKMFKNSRSLLKSSIVDTMKISDMIEEVRAFNCKKCGLLCRLEHEMIDHIKTIHLAQNSKENTINEEIESVIYLCGICGKIGYNSQELLRQHMINVHEVEEFENISEMTTPVIPCKNNKKKSEGNNISTNILRDYQLFVQHQQKSVSKIRCSVKYCESRFATDEIRQLHEKCHSDYPFPSHEPGHVIRTKSLQDYRYKCTECDTRFVLWKSCSSHLWTRHKIDIGLYSCPLCTKFKSISPHLVFTHLSTAHLSSNHPTLTTKACLCNICGARYKSLTQLRIHIERAHSVSSPSESHACPTCQRTFATAQSLRKHADQMHVKNRLYACSLCGYRSARKDSVDKHVRGHTGERPFKCGVCGFSTGDKSTMKRHEMRHLGTTSYTCPHCPYTSIQSTAYKKHLLHNHPSEGGFYTCTICATQYIRQAAFSAHMRDHRLGFVQNPITLDDIEGTEEDEDSPAALVSKDVTTVKRKLPLVSILRCTTILTNPDHSDPRLMGEPS